MTRYFQIAWLRRCVITLFAFVLAFTHCVFSDVSSNCLPERSAHPSIHVLSLYKRMKSHISCIYLTFSDVCFQMLPTGYICLTFIHCVFSNVSSSGLSEWMQNHIGCTCLLFLRCVFSNIPSDCPPWRMCNHTFYICMVFLQCFKCLFKCSTREDT